MAFPNLLEQRELVPSLLNGTHFLNFSEYNETDFQISLSTIRLISILPQLPLKNEPHLCRCLSTTLLE